MVSPTHPDDVPPPPATVDVVVVGAGIAGLAVADALVDRGRSVVVLERRDRVGGRLLSPRLATGDGRVDLGATWFWPGEARVAELVQRLGVATHDHHLAGDALYQTTDGVQRLTGNPIDVPSWRFTDGAESLAQALAATLPADIVRLGATVTAVSGGAITDPDAGGRFDDPLRVTWAPTTSDGDGTDRGRGGVIETGHVVLALPPALAAAHLAIEPPLSEPLARLAATTPVWMGTTAKVVVHYDHPFWRDRGLAGSAFSHTGPMRELHDMSGPDGHPAVLFGFAPASAAAPAPTEAAVRAQLAALFGPEGAEPTEVLIADWRSESATSPDGAEDLGDYRTYGHESYQRPTRDGRLHWASTETSPVAPGHIEGALAAAHRAAAAIDTDLTTRPRTQGVTP